MLILTRRVGETINVGKDIAITVIAVKGRDVRLGFKAPKEVAVHRGEIYARIGPELISEAPRAALTADA